MNLSTTNIQPIEHVVPLVQQLLDQYWPGLTHVYRFTFI